MPVDRFIAERLRYSIQDARCADISNTFSIGADRSGHDEQAFDQPRAPQQRFRRRFLLQCDSKMWPSEARLPLSWAPS